MRFVFAVSLFFSYLIVCYSQPKFQFETAQSKITIPFRLINNLIFIPIDVNGETLTFLLDTGVEQTILFSLDDKEQVKLFQLEKINITGLGSNIAIEAVKSSDNKVEAKDFVDFKHEIYLVLDQDFNFSSLAGIPVNGIIGYHFFKDFPIEIDYKKKKIFIYKEATKKLSKKLKKNYKQESITIENKKPYYLSNIATVDKNHQSKMLLDTGNSDAIWMFVNKQSKLKVPSPTIQDFLGRGFSGNIYGERARILSFSFGNRVFENAIGTFPDSTSIKSVTFVKNRMGSIGGEVLSRFSVVFDYPNAKLYTASNSKINEQFNFNMSGIEVQHDGLEWVQQKYQELGAQVTFNYKDFEPKSRLQDNLQFKFVLKPSFKIYNIRSGSPAEKSGLKPNDKILKINGQRAYNSTIEKINDLLKSEEGKTIEMEIERDSKTLIFKFQLKKII